MSISDAQAKVREFHIKFGVAAPDGPQDETDWNAHVRRHNWIDDELTEVADAIRASSVPGIADGYIDILYFALGGLVELGIDGGSLFDAVHAANMAKVKLPGVAKIAKPDGWTAPDIAGLIEAQRRARKAG